MKQMKNTAILLRCLMLCGVGCFQVILIVLAMAMILESVIWPGVVLLTCLEICLIGLAIFLLHKVPVVTLEEEGAYVKKFFKTRFYPWKSFGQMGYQWTHGSWGSKCKELVLVLHNTGETIHLPPLSEEVRLFVESHYGPLDFDSTEDKRET